MLPIMILFGFAMLTLGVALLFLGEVPFLGTRIPAMRSRLIGGLLVGFLPTAWIVWQVFKLVFGPDVVEGPVVVALWFCVQCIAIFAILFRVVVPKSERLPDQPASSPAVQEISFAETTPEGESGATMPWTEPEPAKKPSVQKTRKPTTNEKDPFDFS